MINQFLSINKLVVLFLVIFLLIGNYSMADEVNFKNTQLSSPLPNLNKLLLEKKLPFKQINASLSDNHPDKISNIDICIKSDSNSIKTLIKYNIKLGIFKSLKFEITIIDKPIKTETELICGNISEVTISFFNNYGVNKIGWQTKITKTAYFNNKNQDIPADILADLQKIYDSVANAILNQKNYIVHEIVHDLEIENFFMRYNFINNEDILNRKQNK